MGTVPVAATGTAAEPAAENATVVEGSPDLDTNAPDARFDPGEDGTLTIEVTNDATLDDDELHPQEAIDRALNARSTDVEVTDTMDAPMTVRTDQRSIGTVDPQDSETTDPPLDVIIDEDAEAGVYEIEVGLQYTDATRVEYEYDEDAEEYLYSETTEEVTETRTVEIEILPETRFDVQSVDHNVTIGDQGELAIEVENDGDEDITDAVVTAIAGDQDVFFGSGNPTAETYVGEWDAGETVELQFRAGALEDANERPYPIELDVEYDDEDGEPQSDAVLTSFTPDQRQSITVVDIDHEVSIDDQGELTIEVENDGPRDARAGTVVVESQDAAVEFNPDGPGTPSSEAFVGDLDAGETATASYQIGTTSDAIQKPYPIDVTLEYEDDDGRERTSRSDTIDFIPDAEQEFSVRNATHDVPIDGRGELSIQLGNDGPANTSQATVIVESRDSAIQFNPGLGGTPSSETFVGDLDDGSLATASYRVGATDDAIEKPYPIDVIVEYEDEEGNELVVAAETIELEPDPRRQFEVIDVEHDVTIGDDGTLDIELENRGSRSVRDATVVVESQDTAVEFNPDGAGSPTSEAFVEILPAGFSQTVSYRIGTTSDAIEKPYPIDVTVEYEDVEGDQRSAETTFEFVPEAEQGFDVIRADHDVTIGDPGTLDLLIVNRGPVDARDAVLTAEATDTAIEFGFPNTGSPTAERFLGDLDANEPTEVSYRLSTTDEAIVESYPIDLTLEYEDPDGNERTARTMQVGVRPDAEQTFAPTSVDHNVSIDDTGNLSLGIENEGPKDAHAVTVTAETQDPALQFNPDAGGTPTTELGVAEWEAGDELDFEYRLAATSDAIETQYPIDVTVAYENEDGDEMTEQGFQIELVPEPRQQFAVRSLDHTVSIDDDGIVELELENRGPNDARSATVTLESTDTAVQIGSATDEPIRTGELVLDADEVGSPISEAYVGDWEAGEQRTVRYVAAATDDAIQREYPLEVTVAYENEDGEEMTARTDRAGMEPAAEQRFAIENVESSLRVGQDGNLEGELVNAGDQPVDGVVVQYDAEIDNVAPRERTYAVGSLDPGESAPVSFRLGVTGEAEPGPRTAEFIVRYRNVQDDIRVSDTIDVNAEVEERRDRFSARVANSTVAAGETEIVEFEVENRDDETLRNIRVKLFTSSPLDSGDTEAFITELEPGETRTIPFEVEASDGAVPRTYPVSMDFRFDDERNETKLSRTQNVAVTVTEPDDSGFGLWLWLVLGLVVVAAAGGYWLYGRTGDSFDPTELDPRSSSGGSFDVPGFSSTDDGSTRESDASAQTPGSDEGTVDDILDDIGGKERGE